MSATFGGIGSVATVVGAARATWFALAAYVGSGLVLLTLPWPSTLAAALVQVPKCNVMYTPGELITFQRADISVAVSTAEGLITVNGQPQHEDYVYPGDAPSDIPFTVRVPPGRVWLMGDHRSVSVDSRSLLGAPGGGLIRTERIVGTAERVVWPLDRARSLEE